MRPEADWQRFFGDFQRRNAPFPLGQPRNRSGLQAVFARLNPNSALAASHHMLHDFRFAFRQLGKARAFTAAAVIVLALGIGVNTAIFSLVNALLFQPPHYPKPDEVVQVFSQDKKNPKTFRGFEHLNINRFTISGGSSLLYSFTHGRMRVTGI